MDTPETGQKVLPRLIRIWWVGFKVFCQWLALSIILGLLCLPLAGLAYLAGENAGRVLLWPFILLAAPIFFYLTSKYLLMLDNDKRSTVEHKDGSPQTSEGEDRARRTRIVISTVVAFLIAGFLFSPPDLISQLTGGAMAALLCVSPLLILGRFRFMKSAPTSVHALVSVLVCIIAVLAVLCLAFMGKIGSLERETAHGADSTANSSVVSSLP